MASDIQNIVSTISDFDNDKNKNKKSTKIRQKKPNIQLKKHITESVVSLKPVKHPLWLSVSEAAKLGGVNTKTVRRAIQERKITYKILKNRYQLDFNSVISYFYSKTKLKNKINFFGIGQYIEKWRS